MDHGAGFGGLRSATKWRIEFQDNPVQRTPKGVFCSDFKALTLT
jgi:hypothetical protein